MDRIKFYKAIGLPKEIRLELEEVKPQCNSEEIKRQIRYLLDRNKSESAYKDLKKLLSSDPGNLKLLYCYLEAAILCHKTFKENNISDDIYFLSMKAFTRLLEEDKTLNSKYIFDKGWWLHRFTSGTIFRIGELEYELYNKDDNLFISIHIPSDSNLTPEKVTNSIEKARVFISKTFPRYRKVPYICDSWLLAPELDNFLDKDSNILSFKNRFKVIDQKQSKEFIEFLFNVKSDTPYEELPTNTSLQKKVKNHLLEGRDISWTKGILID